MEVFDLFDSVPYVFIELNSVEAGHKVVREDQTTGNFKFRDGMVQEGNREAYTAQSTLKIRPDEAFVERLGGHLKLVGHGVRVDGQDYRIEGVSVARDDDMGSVAFYKATLKKGVTWQSQASALPLA